MSVLFTVLKADEILFQEEKLFIFFLAYYLHIRGKKQNVVTPLHTAQIEKWFGFVIKQLKLC